MVSGPGRGHGGDGDDDLTSGPPPFSDEGMRRIVYGEDRRMVANALGGSAPDSRSAAFDEDTAELEADLQKRRNLVPIVTALAAVFCFGAIVWYAYTWGTGQMSSEDLPIVSAEPMPEKVKPEQPGGMDVPHQDKLVLNDGTAGEGAPRVEQLLPLPEIPQPPQPLETPAETAEAGGEEAMPGTAPEAPLVAEAPEGAAAIPAPPAESAEALEDLAEGTPAEAASETATAEIAKPIPKPGAGGDDQIAALLEKEPHETANGETAEAAPPAPAAPPSPATTQTAALTEGDVVVQLSSVKSEDAAAREWARLQKSYPAQLGERALSLETAEVKGTTYYRVQTGPFASRDAAAKVCAELKARNQDCLVKQR